MPPKPDDIAVIVATDCGGATTKAMLFEKVGDEHRRIFRGREVAAPRADVEIVEGA